MLWKFSFASGSTLESLFTRETPPTVEEVMDESDVLNECKAQNQRLVSFLSREQTLKSLLQWIVSGLDELNEQITAAEEAALAKAIADPDSYPPFDPSLASSTATSASASSEKAASGDHDKEDADSPPLEPAKMAEEAMRRAESERDLSSKRQKDEEEGDAQRSRYPSVAAEILTCELWIVPETIMLYKETLLRPFFDAIMPDTTSHTTVAEDDAETIFRRTEKERAKLQYWSDEDEERERKREVIVGLWCKVMVSLISKRTTEMIKFLQTVPNAISRLCTYLTSPSIQDLVLRLVSCEEAGVSGTIAWLSEQQLVPLLIHRLSPHYAPNTHNTVGELLKSIVTLCAPTPFNPHGGNLQEQQSGGVGATARDNRLTREIVSEGNLELLLGYMLDPAELKDAEWKGVNGDGSPSYLDPFVVHPLPNIASATSSLTYISSLLVEVIRRNNSDFAEPHLFHTLRNRLMNMQMAQADEVLSRVRSRRSDNGDAESESTAEEDASRDKMETAVKEMSESMGIVHLGTLLRMVVERFGRLNDLVKQPRSQVRSASKAQPTPLTYERLRLVELLAELLHSSSMAILNRDTAAAPIYSAEGILGGGLAGLEALGEAIEQDGEGEGDNMPESAGHVIMGGADDEGITPARELPVSSAATTNTSTSTSDSSSGSPSSGSEVGSVDERIIEELDLDNETPTASPATSMILSPSTPRAPSRKIEEPREEATVSVESVDVDVDDENPPPPPPTGPEDEERLKAVRDASLPATSGSTVERTDASDRPVVGSTAPPSITSESAAVPSALPATPALELSPTSIKGDDVEAAVAPGRMLKSAYISHGVIPTLMDLFFEFPDNDFLHYLVYDVVQQVLSGRLQPGLNRDLVLEMICKGDLVTRVLKTAVTGEIDNANGKKRAAYMGHLNFIAEEIVKFLTRCPVDLLDEIAPSIPQPAWDEYVMGTLTDTKMRESRPLAGGKPMPGMSGSGSGGGSGSGMGMGMGDDSSDSSDDDSDDDLGGRSKSTLGSFGTFGEPLKRTKAGDGFVHRGEGEGDEDEDDRVRAYYWRGGSDRRHVDSSDEDDDDAEWMKPGDDFGGFQAYRTSAADDSDEDDAWGSFSSGSTPAHNENAGDSNPFGDDSFDAFDESFTPSVQSRSAAAAASGSGTASSSQNIRGQPLTPHDWFDREFNEAWGDDVDHAQSEDMDVDDSGEGGEAEGDGEGGGREEDSSDDEEGTPNIVIPKMEDEEDVADASRGVGSMNLGERAEGEGESEGDGKGKGDIPGPSTAPIAIPPRSTPIVSDTALAADSSADSALASSPSAAPAITPRSPSAGSVSSASSSSTAKSASSPARRAPPPPPPNRRRAGSGAAPPSPSVLLGASQGQGQGQGSSKLGASALSQDALLEQPEGAASPSTSPVKGSKPIDMASERPDRKGSMDAPSSLTGSAGVGGGGMNGSALSTSPVKRSSSIEETGPSSPTSPTARHRRRSSSVSNPPDPALVAATNEQEPLGPGVSRDTEITQEGMLKKHTAEGGEVVVPMDEVALGVDEAMADDK